MIEPYTTTIKSRSGTELAELVQKLDVKVGDTTLPEEIMRKATVIAMAVAFSLPLVTIARADETVIKKDEPSSTTIIKKKHDPEVLPVPHEHGSTTVIKKERD